MATPDTRPSASPATHHGTRTHRSRLLSLLDSDADEEPGIGACRSSSNHHDPRPIHSPSVSGQHSLASAARHAVLLATTVLAFGLASAAYAAPLPGPGPVPVPVPVPAAALAISPRAASTSASGESASSSSSSDGLSSGRKATYGIVVPILIVLSGIFAGLTLGYMSLDETQLAVLAAQGTPKQQDAARKIMPIRKDGHLLLTTLLIANMITNETLPIVADPLLGGGWKAVLFSIVVIVVFAELIPQSVCSRFGLAIGAKMAYPTRIVIIVLWPVAYPVSRILHLALGPHQGIIYRRSELKELVGIHAATGGHGGDLKSDTVLIVGGALDLQAKTVRVAMTPIQEVFMLPITAKLDYPTLGRVLNSGHSRVPIYVDDSVEAQEALAAHNFVKPGYASGSTLELPCESISSVEKTLSKTVLPAVESPAIESTPTVVPCELSSEPTEPTALPNEQADKPSARAGNTARCASKRIIGTLLVKSCVLLDPEDGVPVREMVINEMPTVPANESLLHLLNVFQQGRSHMAVVARAHPVDVANTLAAVETDTASPHAGVEPNPIPETKETTDWAEVPRRVATEDPEKAEAKCADPNASSLRWRDRLAFWRRRGRGRRGSDDDTASVDSHARTGAVTDAVSESNGDGEFDLLEDEVQCVDEQAKGMPDEPLGIITLEDVLEELLGSEIWDEYDEIGPSHGAVTAVHPSVLSSAGLTSPAAGSGQPYLSFSSLRAASPSATNPTGGSGTPTGAPAMPAPGEAVTTLSGTTSGQSTPREVLSLPPSAMAPALSRLLAPLRRVPSGKDAMPSDAGAAPTAAIGAPSSNHGEAPSKAPTPSTTPVPRSVATYQITRPHSGDRRTGLSRAVPAHRVLASPSAAAAASDPTVAASATSSPPSTPVNKSSNGTATTPGTPRAQSPAPATAVAAAAASTSAISTSTANAAAVTAAAAATARGRTPGTIPVLFPMPAAADDNISHSHSHSHTHSQL